MQKIYPDRVLKKLANLQLALGLLLVIAIVIAIGTIIEQDQTIMFYQQNYPENNPILGFITWKLLLFLSLDHVYSAYWFIALLIIFALSLLACTLSVQFPTLRRLRRWKFYNNTEKLNYTKNSIPKNASNSLVYQLHASNYTFFRQGNKNYAYRGLLGRFGPIVVHASLILLLIGSSIGTFSGYTAQQFVPRGEIFHTQNLIKFGRFSNLSQKFSYRVNDFWITYTDKFNTNQFYSDLSLIDNFGNELKRKTIFVNEPLIYKGTTLYQTDWDIVGLKFTANNSINKQLPLKKVTKVNQKFWFGSIKTSNTKEAQTFSVLCNDLTGRIYIYDQNGTLITNCQLGEVVSLTNELKLQFLEFLTITGLQLKTDPGINTIYFSFFLLMVSTYVSFISYSQIWGVEECHQLTVMGTSNRAVLFFQAQFRTLIKKLA